MIELVKAKLSDIPAMQALVVSEVKDGIILDRTEDEVATNIRSYVLAKDGKGHRDILVAAPFSSDDNNPISVYSKGKLAERASSPVPLNAGISGIAFDLSDPSQRLFVCNRQQKSQDQVYM